MPYTFFFAKRTLPATVPSMCSCLTLQLRFFSRLYLCFSEVKIMKVNPSMTPGQGILHVSKFPRKGIRIALIQVYNPTFTKGVLFIEILHGFFPINSTCQESSPKRTASTLEIGMLLPSRWIPWMLDADWMSLASETCRFHSIENHEKCDDENQTLPMTH